MELAIIGVSHQTAPVEVRSVFAFTDSQKVDFIARMQDLGAEEAVLLSTCNRSEIYVIGKDMEELIPRLREALIGFCGATEEEAACLTVSRGREAVRQLFRVTCGLESMVVGEDQILGQVKEAFEFAAQMGATGKALNKMFREAITLSKRVKTELKISQVPLSISYIGIKALAEALGGLAGKRVMLVGLGKMNRLSLKYLLDEGAGAVWLCSRDQQKARALAEEAQPTGEEEARPPCSGTGQSAAYLETGQEKTKIRLAGFEDRYALTRQVDAVVTATASPHTVFRAKEMPELDHPLLFLDIAVPRDVDEAMGRVSGARVLDIDDLRQTAAENLSRRVELAAEADKLTEEATDGIMDWLLRSRVDPSIQSINRRCQTITEDVTSYLFSKLRLSDKEKRLVTKVVSSGLRRMAREPVLKLKEAQSLGQQDEYIRLVEELFDLKG